jgi:hypothetical protein
MGMHHGPFGKIFFGDRGSTVSTVPAPAGLSGVVVPATASTGLHRPTSGRPVYFYTSVL